MKKAIFSALAACVIASTGLSSVVINFGMGDAYSGIDTNTAAFPTGGLIVLLSLDSGSWGTDGAPLITLFSNLTDGFTPAGVTLAGKAGADADGFFTAAIEFNYSGGFNVGDELLVVLYPTLTTGSLSPGLNTPGFFYRTSLVLDGSDIAYIAPSDGGTWAINNLTINQGGSSPNGQFTAGAGSQAGDGSGYIGGGFTTVPEPSTYAMLAISALGLGGYMIRRRRRAA